MTVYIGVISSNGNLLWVEWLEGAAIANVQSTIGGPDVDCFSFGSERRTVPWRLFRRELYAWMDANGYSLAGPIGSAELLD